jgi:hypothetical protein
MTPTPSTTRKEALGKLLIFYLTTPLKKSSSPKYFLTNVQSWVFICLKKMRAVHPLAVRTPACARLGASLPYKTELKWGLQIYRWELLSNSKPLGSIIIIIGQSKTWSTSHIISITLFSTGSLLAAFFSSLSKLTKYVGEKPLS